MDENKVMNENKTMEEKVEGFEGGFCAGAGTMLMASIACVGGVLVGFTLGKAIAETLVLKFKKPQPSIPIFHVKKESESEKRD